MALAILAGLVVLAMAIGAILPKAHVASRTVRVNAAPDQVWQAMTDVNAFPLWRRDVVAVESLSGAPKLSWRETDRHKQNITLVATQFEPPRKMITRIADRNLPFGGEWQYDLAPDGDGTRVTITERGEIYNPVFRLVARFILGYHKTMDGYLAALSEHLGKR